MNPPPPQIGGNDTGASLPSSGPRELLAFLYQLRNRGSKYGLERMERFASVLGHPERKLHCIHIAGTNGKGSTAAMLRSILSAAGLRVGLFTSPHLVYLGERIEISGEALPPEKLFAGLSTLRRVAQQIAPEGHPEHPSFFEYLTALAFTTFASEQVDIAILETGLGGRLDATNIVSPLLTAITSISLDHTEILGSTLTDIAREKAGIIKPRVPVVIGKLPPEAEQTIRQIAARQDSPVHSIREIFGDGDLQYPATNLYGDFQRRNAAIASLLAQLLPPPLAISRETIDLGLRQVRWPARWEHRKTPWGELILDASHNREGCEALAENLSRLSESLQQPVPVALGSISLTRAQDLVASVLPYASDLILLAPNHPTAVLPSTLRELVPLGFKGSISTPTLADFPASLRHFPQVPVVLTGSIYLIGQILELLPPPSQP
ncbi:MAG: bifunctional folylpolyglutamate synthase/dihydrofolate synthase [Puniceicoccaceae bacterium]